MTHLQLAVLVNFGSICTANLLARAVCSSDTVASRAGLAASCCIVLVKEATNSVRRLWYVVYCRRPSSLAHHCMHMLSNTHARTRHAFYALAR
jgi:hypothetical protein